MVCFVRFCEDDEKHLKYPKGVVIISINTIFQLKFYPDSGRRSYLHKTTHMLKVIHAKGHRLQYQQQQILHSHRHSSLFRTFLLLLSVDAEFSLS